jgi:protein-disulfide isomerase
MPKSKREIIRERRRKQQLRGRIIAIVLVVFAALLIAGVLIFNGSGLSGKSGVDANVTPISPRSFNVATDRNTIGDPNAPVKMDVWEDFQCSGCLSYSVKLEPSIFQNYVATGKVFYTFRFYPLIEKYTAGNTESSHSANAALCAADQGRFWDYHDILFANWGGENQGAYRDERLLAFARSLNLEMDSFETCFNTMPYTDQIEQDFQLGKQMGINSTPSIFVNGKIVLNSENPNGYIPSYDDIVAAIEAALAGN